MKRVCSSAAGVAALIACAGAPPAQNGNVLSVLDIQTPQVQGVPYGLPSRDNFGVASFVNATGDLALTESRRRNRSRNYARQFGAFLRGFARSCLDVSFVATKGRPLLMHTFHFVALVLATAIAPAQRQTIVVDSQNRPGTDFTQLPAAIDAAVDGDVVRVRDGEYAGFQTSKGIAVLGDPGASVVTPSAFLGDIIRIANVPSGQKFVLEGLDVSAATTTGAVRGIVIEDCAGQVHVERAVIDSSLGFTKTGLAVIRSHVTLTGGVIVGYPGIWVFEGTLLAVDVEARGTDFFTIAVGANDGVVATESHVVLSRCTLRGGTGGGALNLITPGAGLHLDRSTALVTGDDSSSIRAGRDPLQRLANAIAGSGGSLTLHPNVVLSSTGGAASIDTRLRPVIARVPALLASAAPLGGNATAEVFGEVSDSAFLFFGLPSAPQTLPGLGDLWLDPNGPIITVASGVLGTSQRLTTGFQVPNAPALAGRRFLWQGASVQTSGVGQLSNAAVIVIN